MTLTTINYDELYNQFLGLIIVMPQRNRYSQHENHYRYIGNPSLSLENHQDGVYLHMHGVTLSLQAILVCSSTLSVVIMPYIVR